MKLTHDELRALFRDLGEERVLSVYLRRESTDHGTSDSWRRRLDKALAEARAALELDDPEVRSAFDQAADHVQTGLADVTGVLPSSGWMGLATPDGLRLGEAVSGPVVELVRWARGPILAPSLRLLKQARPVVIALVDARRARVFRYQFNELAEVGSHEADPVEGDLAEAGVSKGATGSTGVRGETGRDAGRRALQRATDKLMEEVAASIKDEAGAEASLVLGGVAEAVSSLRSRLPGALAERATEVSELFVEMDGPALDRVVREAASELGDRRQAHLLDGISEAAGGGRGTLGWNDTQRALRAGAVQLLLVSRAFASSQSDDCEELVRLALEQGAEVEDLGGEAGARLDDLGGGVGARLRFVPPSLKG